MVMVADLIPGLKRFLSGVGLREAALRTVTQLVIAFILHRGRMSTLQAAGSIRSETRHRAQIGRLLRRPSFRRLDLNSVLRQALLAKEAGKGLFIFIVDATLCSQAGEKTPNTYSTGNRQRRPKKGRRYGKNKHARKTCHSFTMGLLITPSGFRIPFSFPYHTRDYCQQKGLKHRTTAEAAAEMIRQYQFRNFESVESWSELALTAFLYLEHYRAEQLQRRGLTKEEKAWWRHQRTHGLCQAVRLASEESELKYLAKRLETPGGIANLKRLIHASFAPEYRAAT